MKCPSCGMNIRDDTRVCGYCGEEIPQSLNKNDSPGRQFPSGGRAAMKDTGVKGPLPDEDETGEDEEEGGLSPYLQPGEQVLIGSLNVSVKKFFFHAYLTDRRIFLIDTQEKKLKVTAKDVPRDTIAGCISEYSENSDPVLVLSIRSPDDEIKTMKIVFVQNGMDRSAEIDEWLSLLNHREEEPVAKRPEKEPEVPAQRVEPVPEEEPLFAEPEIPVRAQELKPARKPVKHLEKQPPVKRIVSFSRPPEEEVQHAPPAQPARRTQVREIAEPAARVPVVTEPEPAVPPAAAKVPAVKKPEVRSAMKVAMKSAMKPLATPMTRPARKDMPEHVPRRPVVEPEPAEVPEPPRKQRVRERVQEPLREPVREQEPERELPPRDEPAGIPQFCHNCGTKLPLEANFCPGCGTRLGQGRTLTGTRTTTPPRERRSGPSDTVIPERKPVPPPKAEEEDEDEIESEKPQPTRPPIKKAPKGSEMTILHKFLRR